MVFTTKANKRKKPKKQQEFSPSHFVEKIEAIKKGLFFTQSFLELLIINSPINF